MIYYWGKKVKINMQRVLPSLSVNRYCASLVIERKINPSEGEVTNVNGITSEGRRMVVGFYFLSFSYSYFLQNPCVRFEIKCN